MAAAIAATTSPLRNLLPGRQIPSTGQQWFQHGANSKCRPECRPAHC
jgi:hypothetical protein